MTQAVTAVVWPALYPRASVIRGALTAEQAHAVARVFLDLDERPQGDWADHLRKVFGIWHHRSYVIAFNMSVATIGFSLYSKPSVLRFHGEPQMIRPEHSSEFHLRLSTEIVAPAPPVVLPTTEYPGLIQ